MKKQNWFEISTKGLKELQSGKPKHYIVRELISNAFDENITKCEVELTYSKGIIKIVVKDDNPEGFKDLTDAYTLFKTTPKRRNPTQRGRFNVGEKQAISLCEKAEVSTTKGTILFDKRGRHSKRKKSVIGSTITLWLKGTSKDCDSIIEMLKKYLSPKHIQYTLNNIEQEYQEPFKVINASLETERLENKIIKRVQRKTQINILKTTEDAYLYEMGIPICKLDCKYCIDVQQKIPLSIDRENVPEKFLNIIYAEVLNVIYSHILPEEASSNWIRKAMSNKRISKEALNAITTKRFGDKVCVANPFDKNSIDDAISKGYNVVYGSELSKKEWSNLKEHQILSSSSDLFGRTIVTATPIQPNEKQMLIVKLVQQIAMRVLGFNVKVYFVKSKATVAAEYSNKTLMFNISRLSKNFFDIPVSEQTLNLILHELGHQAGGHTEHKYHELLTKMASQLILIALNEPSFFKI